MKKIFLFVGGGILLLGAVFLVHSSQAYLMPSVYVQDLSINKTEFQTGETISGSFKISSAAKSIVPGVKYQVQILGGIINDIPTIDYYIKREGEILTIEPQETIVKNFSFSLPQGLTGDYLLRVALVNEQGNSLGWEDQLISIKGVDSFILLSESYFIKDNEQIHPGLGPTYQAGEAPQIQFKITNDTNTSLILTPKIDVYERNLESAFVKSYEEQKIEIAAKSNKIINLNLPQFTNPQVYVASLKLFNNERLASNTIYFRWVIAGLGANIWQTTVDKTSYKKGEQAKVNIFYTGPADASELGEATVAVTILNSAGKIVGKAQQTVNLKAGQGQELPVLVEITKNVDSPIIKTEIIKNNQTLASHQVAVTKPGAKPTKEFPYFWLIIILVIIILVPILKKLLIKKPTSLIFLLLLSATFLIFFADVNNAKADVIVEGQMDGATVTINRPYHNWVLIAGERYVFSGSISASVCTNAFKNAELGIYLTDGLGGNRLDLLPIIFISGTGNSVQWHRSFVIPDGYYYGRARAYIEFKGTIDIPEGNSVSFSGTAYEHIYIIPKPFVELKVNEEDTSSTSPLVLGEPANYTLNWRVNPLPPSVPDDYWYQGCILWDYSTSPATWTSENEVGSKEFTNKPAGNYNYKIDCRAGGDTFTDRAYVKVLPSGQPLPSVDLKVDGQDGPIERFRPATYNLQWKSENTVSCSAPWTSDTSTEGIQQIDSSSQPLGLNGYSITCTDSVGNIATDTVWVVVKEIGGPGNPPSCTFTANPNQITLGASSTLSWDCENADSCTIDHNVWACPPGNCNAPGSKAVYPNSTTNYTLYCSNEGSLFGAWYALVRVFNPYGIEIIEVPPY